MDERRAISAGSGATRRAAWLQQAALARPSRASLARLALALLLAAAAAGPTSCARGGGAPVARPAPVPTTPGERDARIRDLEAAIGVEQEALRELISAGPVEGSDSLHTSQEMRAIAERLPALQDELRGLLRAREIAAAREKRARESSSEPGEH